MLKVRLQWDASVSDDVVEQQLHMTIDDVEQPVISGLLPDVTEQIIEVERDATVAWFIRSIDGAGNVTDMDPTSFVAADTIPPAPATNPRATVIGETDTAEDPGTGEEPVTEE